MTDTEQRLWTRIRRKQLNNLQFYRQRIIGQYIADFYCPHAKLVLEVDGLPHFSDRGKRCDGVRDEYFTAVGLRVLHISNLEIMNNIDGVIESIIKHL
jgi:very-short-patch-repair endonuclease